MSHVEHNGSGFVDPTVDKVIKKEYDHKKRIKEDCKYNKMSKEIKEILKDNGYILEGPISLINSDSGRKRRIY
jgi:hypothetical protein